MTLKELYELIDKKIAPFSLAEEWDNSGLLCGDEGQQISVALIALDITPDTVRQAKALGAQAIVSHHPVIFHPLRTLPAGSTPYLLANAGIGAVCAHTNLDIAKGGVNDCLAAALGLLDIRPLCEGKACSDSLSLGRLGTLPEPMSPAELTELVKTALCPQGGIRYADGGKPISTVAVCGGAGGDLIWKARELGADAMVTSEISHHIFLDCIAASFTALDAGHFDTERVVLPPLLERLQRLAPEIKFIQATERGPVTLNPM